MRLRKISRSGNYQNLSNKQFSKALKIENYFCGLAVCDVCVPLRRFSKASFPKSFCHAGEGYIQKYVTARKIFHGNLSAQYLLLLLWLIQTRLVQQFSFRRRSRAILLRIRLIWKMLMFCLAALLIIRPCYIFGRSTDKIQVL